MTADAAMTFLHRDGVLHEWAAPFSGAGFPADAHYFGDVVRALRTDRRLDLHRIILTWEVDSIPVTGNDVIVLCVGDEWCRWPRYANRVCAVFKTHGLAPSFRGSGANLRTRLGLSGAIQLLRMIVLGLRNQPSRLRWWLTPAKRRSIVDVIPLGTYNLSPQQAVPAWESRPTHVGFRGSVIHGSAHAHGVRRFLPSPKTLARQAMLRGVAAMAETSPYLRISMTTIESFAQSSASSPLEYTESLGSTRVCLAPRGTNVETFRALEAMTMGCLVVAERLPRHWFYAKGGIIEIENWARLPHVLDFLNDPDGGKAAAERHLTALKRQWEEQCSPPAVARHCLERLVAPGH